MAGFEYKMYSGTLSNIEPLMKRASIFLKDCAWDKAESYCEKVLDIDPENCNAYMYLLLAHLKKSTLNDLVDSKEPFDSIDYYKKAFQFADSNLRAGLTNLNKENYYRRAISAFSTSKTESEYKSAKAIFDHVIDYKDAKRYADMCVEEAEAARIEAIYQEGCCEYEKDTLDGYVAAISALNRVKDYKDSAGLIEKSNLRIEKITVAHRKAVTICTIIVVLCSVIAVLLLLQREETQNERAARIMANFPGKTMSYTEYRRSDNNEYDIYYESSRKHEYKFLENGKCTETETYKCIWSDTAKKMGSEDEYSTSTYNYEYSVHISITGKVTIEIRSNSGDYYHSFSYPLNVNDDDEPESFKIGYDTYRASRW